MLLSGGIGVGKTTIALALSEHLHWQFVSVRHALTEVLALDANRRTELQRRGAELDRATNGRWLVEYLTERLETTRVVVDSVRTVRQTVPILDRVSDSRLVFLDARVATRRKRFEISARTDPVKRSLPFSDAVRHPTEDEVTRLRSLAHVMIESDGMTEAEVVANIVSSLRL